MVTLYTSFFRLDVPEYWSCWIEVDSKDELTANSIFFSNNEGLQASLEVLAGSDAESLPFQCEQSVVAEIDSLAGYIDDYDENFPNEIVGIYNDEANSHAHRHFFRFIGNLAVHGVLVSSYIEDDFEIMRKLLESFDVFKTPNFGLGVTRMKFSLLDVSKFDSVGNNRYVLAKDEFPN